MQSRQTARQKNNKNEQAQRTIAFLTTGPIDPNNRAIWSGVHDAARDNAMNLVCFPGRLVNSPVGFEAQRNIIYEMVNKELIDGLVVMGGVNAWLDMQETHTFLAQFQPKPIVTTGILLEGIPGVSVDNYQGMYDVITHMVAEHDLRRIAFIRGQAGHQEAMDRYQAYLDVLDEFRIPFDETLVYQGNFKESGGVDGVRVLLDERNVEFNALVAASDNMAIGAMKTLQARGYRIPSDIAVAGLNNEEQGLVINPPLTTAPLHFYEQGYRAAEMVMTMMDGGDVDEKVILPTRLVVRQSCGCADPLVTHAEVIPHTEKLESFTEEIRLLNNLVYGGKRKKLQLPADESVRRAFPILLKIFLDESRGKTNGHFLQVFGEIVQESTYTNETFPRWHEIISALRQFAISHYTDNESRLRTENMIQQARIIIGESARRFNAYQVLQADEKLHSLGEISQGLSVVNNIGELIDVLEQSLMLMHIPRCYLFMYEDSLEHERLARFIFSYEDHQRNFFDLEGPLFPARQMLPEKGVNLKEQHSLVVEPLYFREDQLGYAVFEAAPWEEAIYEILGGQISASLKRTILTERNIRLYDEAVSAREAAEKANLLKSHFLSMVSHELRTPLSLIVGTIEMMLQEEQTSSNPPLPGPYRKDMETIHASSKHLFRLIGDVLDLASNQAGELRLASEPLDLADLFEEIALLGKSMAREKGLEWREQIPMRLPLVLGDRTRLRQVTLNLLSNAVKFTEHGHVAMQVSADDHQVLVEIEDTGMGIPLEEQEVIFDEFHRTERSVVRGYGGIGLGLAITRRLIELHGGRIGVQSRGQEEAGSKFFFTLPVIQQTLDTLPLEPSSTQTALILSEHASTKLKDYLVHKGFEVQVLDVSSREDWISDVMANPPGAVVLDFQPAVKRGWELMQLLKQNPGTQDIPVVFYNLPEEAAEGSILEMEYLPKPVASGELFNAMERLGLEVDDQRRSILVVEDDPKVMDMHVRMLESRVSSRILKARNGRQALDILEWEQPDLVLLDLMMPEVDGFEVLQGMRAREATRNVPVIVLTAQILTTHDMQRLQEGVASVLGKGLFSVEEVMVQVENALSHSKRLGGQASRMVRQAMAYIHEQYQEPITRAMIAGHVAITERYLTQCFRHELGITPIVYLNRYRINRARMLLEKGELSVTTVAMETGFSDSSYFNRVFRKEVGLSPGAYKKGERL